MLYAPPCYVHLHCSHILSKYLASFQAAWHVETFIVLAELSLSGTLSKTVLSEEYHPDPECEVLS